MLRLAIVILFGLATAALSETRWTRDKVVGLHMELIDPKQIESYRCIKDGSVAVDIGTKTKISPQLLKETISTPEWYWKIHGGRLRLFDGFSIREELTLVDIGHGFITVRRRSGKVARFRYCFDCPKT